MFVSLRLSWCILKKSLNLKTMQLTELYWRHVLNGAKWPRKAFLYKWRFQWQKYLRTSTAEWKIKSCTFRSEWGGIMITYFTSPLSLWKLMHILSSIIFQKSSNINWYVMIITSNAIYILYHSFWCDCLQVYKGNLLYNCHIYQNIIRSHLQWKLRINT